MNCIEAPLVALSAMTVTSSSGWSVACASTAAPFAALRRPNCTAKLAPVWLSGVPACPGIVRLAIVQVPGMKVSMSEPTSCHSDQSPRSSAGSATRGQRQPWQTDAGPCMVQPEVIVAASVGTGIGNRIGCW